MSETRYEPYDDGTGVWCWATQMHSSLRRTPSHLPYPLFLELEGGEFGEPDDTTDHIVAYPTREAALAALEAARAKSEGT